MPIKPENRKRYPADWKQIRTASLTRAKHRCEFCGVHNHAWGFRDGTGKFWPVNKRAMRDVGHTKAPFQIAYKNGLLKIIEIVLTIAHLDHTPENCVPENLRALCQRCHLTYDAEMHAQESRITRRKGKALAELF